MSWRSLRPASASPHRLFSQLTGIRPRPDYKYIRENVENIQQNIRKRNASGDVHRIVKWHEEHLSLSKEIFALRKQGNDIAKAMSKLPNSTNGQRGDLVSEGKKIKLTLETKEALMEEISTKLEEEVGKIPNDTHPLVADTEQQLALVGEKALLPPYRLGFTPRSHTDIGELHDLFDFDTGAQIVGSKFYYAKNEAVLLELALINWSIAKLIHKGFTPILPPDLSKRGMLEGTGFRPKDGEHTQVYSIHNTNLCLSGTSEITLAGMYYDKILKKKDLPIINGWFLTLLQE